MTLKTERNQVRTNPIQSSSHQFPNPLCFLPFPAKLWPLSLHSPFKFAFSFPTLECGTNLNFVQVFCLCPFWLLLVDCALFFLHVQQVYLKDRCPLSPVALLWSSNCHPQAKQWPTSYISRMQYYRSFIMFKTNYVDIKDDFTLWNASHTHTHTHTHCEMHVC